jgi:hypothetical protein
MSRNLLSLLCGAITGSQSVDAELTDGLTESARISSAKILAYFATEEDDHECSQLGLNKFDDLMLRN